MRRSLRKTGKKERKREKKDVKIFDDNHIKCVKMDIVTENYFKAASTASTAWAAAIQHQVSCEGLRPSYTYMLYVYVK